MDFGLSEEQQQLKESARAFLSGECPTTFVRKIMATDDSYPRELYAQIAKLGWSGLVVPEKFGGAGLGMLDMAMILEEGGYAAMPGPFLFSSVLAASALKLGGSDQLNSKWLSALAEGKAIGTVAVVESAGSIEPVDIAAVATKDGARWRVNGAKMLVPYANVADFIVVAAKSDAREISLFVVETKAPGVTTRALKNLDLTRRVSNVELKGAPAERLGGGADRSRRSSTRPPKSSLTSSPPARCSGTPPMLWTPAPPTHRARRRWRRRGCAISTAAAPIAPF